MDPFIKYYDEKLFEAERVSYVEEHNKFFQNKEIKILHQNIRSIQKNFEKFCIFLNLFSYKFDVIILTETRIISDDESLYKLQGYDVIYNNGNYNQCDGVLILITSSLKYNFEILNIGDLQVIHLIIDGEKDKVAISALYRSPSTCPKEFNANLENYLNTANTNNSHIYILGL